MYARSISGVCLFMKQNYFLFLLLSSPRTDILYVYNPVRLCNDESRGQLSTPRTDMLMYTTRQDYVTMKVEDR